MKAHMTSTFTRSRFRCRAARSMSPRMRLQLARGSGTRGELAAGTRRSGTAGTTGSEAGTTASGRRDDGGDGTMRRRDAPALLAVRWDDRQRRRGGGWVDRDRSARAAARSRSAARSAATASTTTATARSTTTIRNASARSTTTRARSRPASRATTWTPASRTASSTATRARATTTATGSSSATRGASNTKCPYDQQYADAARDRVLAVGVAVAGLHRLLPQVGPERLRLLRLLPGPGRADADPAGGDLHRRRLRQPGQVPALHAGDPVLEPVRALRDLHRQADDSRRLHARPTRAPMARRRPCCGSDFPPCGPGTNTPANGCPTGLGLRHRLLHPDQTRESDAFSGPSSGYGSVRARLVAAGCGRPPPGRWKMDGSGARPRYWHARGLRMRRETKTWAGRLAAAAVVVFVLAYLPYHVYVRSGLARTHRPAA